MVRKFWTERNLFIKSLTIVLVITCLPAALIGIGFYYFSTAQIEQGVMQTHSAQLKSARGRVDSQLAHIELTASQWAVSPLFNVQIKDTDFYRNFQLTQEISRALFLIKGSSSLIEDAYLYVPSQAVLLSSQLGVQKMSQTSRSQYEATQGSNSPMLWINDPDMPGIGSDVSLIYRLSGGGEFNYGTLIIRLNETTFNAMVRELDNEKKGFSFIIGEGGEWVTTGIDGLSTGTSEEKLIKEAVLRHNEAAGSLVVKAERTSYSVSYARMTKAGAVWIYVTASSLNELTAPVVLMSRTIVTVSGIGLLLAIVLAWYGSRRLYKPIHRLKDQLALQLPKLREGFLMQLMEGHLYFFTENELRERLRQFGWNTAGHSFCAIVVQLDGYTAEDGKFKANDGPLIAFAAANVIEELAAKAFPLTAVVNFQDLTIGLLAALPDEQPARHQKQQLQSLGADIRATVSGLLKLEVTVCLGKPVRQASEIPAALQEIRQALLFQFVEERKPVLDMDEPEASPGFATASYPFAAEKAIHHALRRGEGPEAEQAVARYFDELGANRATEYMLKQAAFCLLGNVLQLFMQMGFTPHHLFQGEQLFEQLARKRGREELCAWFQKKVIGIFIKEFNESHSSQLKQTVMQAIAIMNASYMDDISLELCAERLDVHPVRLSKAFKHVSGQTFIDYLTELRIRKSKELLKDTDCKITEIARLVGYQPTYFNKIFRKQEGMTASEFRIAAKGTK